MFAHPRMHAHELQSVVSMWPVMDMLINILRPTSKDALALPFVPVYTHGDIYVQETYVSSLFQYSFGQGMYIWDGLLIILSIHLWR